ncbi:EscU/YscU/HrcU family type III secretion system export apparatus switch protein [Aquabacterium humicola]|uniref:EscU/YscU/HrcU family type III secretion system export apparatus switch protein n=1 Tax=Aquabacterium humicola TaxID=3237377 RepID=UPI002542D9BF|nr:EscU/YscU/HrcU family type III secretion system export apparatus switch protein [Rubrivivax pictus]
MAEAESEQDKSEAASPYKLERARQRGQSARSPDIGVATVFVALTLCWYGMGDSIARGIADLARADLSNIGLRQWSPDGISAYLVAIGIDSLVLLAPVLVAIALAVGLAAFAQVGPVFSAEPVKPQWDRVNPASGFKRLFSMRMLFETFKSVLKLVTLGIVVWFSVETLMHELSVLGLQAAPQQAAWLKGHIGSLLVKLTLVLVVIALLDLGYVRWEFARKMRMSRREQRDEHKQREGDPRIRSRLRELRMKMLRQARSLVNLPKADVLITNPTHYAIALAYRHGEMAAPQMLAKGAGELAHKLRRAAMARGIPIVQNPPLARALYKRLEVDEWVPEDLYPVVARILVWVYAQRDAQAAARAAT